jgi:hypothetical protein
MTAFAKTDGAARNAAPGRAPLGVKVLCGPVLSTLSSCPGLRLLNGLVGS